MHAENKDIKGYLSKGTGTIEIKKVKNGQAITAGTKGVLSCSCNAKGSGLPPCGSGQYHNIVSPGCTGSNTNNWPLSFAEQGAFQNARYESRLFSHIHRMGELAA